MRQGKDRQGMDKGIFKEPTKILDQDIYWKGYNKGENMR